MSRGTVLVTGASSGIGAACVASLRGAGFEVVATVRSEADEQQLTAQYAGRVTVLRCDVTDAGQVAELGRHVGDLALAGLVNNAGTAVPGPLEYLPVEELRRQLEVNLVGQLAVTQVALPALRRAGGRIVMVGSIADRIAGPMLGAYHASKFGLLGMTDSLRAELAPSGVRVVLVEPGVIATSIWNTGQSVGEDLLAGMPPDAEERYGAQIDAKRTEAARAGERGLPASAVADVITQALTTKRPRPRYLVGRDAKAAAVVAGLPFRLRYRLTAARS